MLNRREILLTQLCLIEKNYKKAMMEQALRQIPAILKVLGMEPVTENEIFNLLIELEASRTEITLKTIMGLRKDQSGKG